MPPRKHLRYDEQRRMIVAADGPRPTDPYYNRQWRHNDFHKSWIPIHHGNRANEYSIQHVVGEWNNYQQNYQPLLRDARHAVCQLRQFYEEDGGTVYIAVGGSPKLVKWQLKHDGFKVAAVNASGIAGPKPTDEFQEYLGRKLRRFSDQQRFVIMDFADTGSSLITLKRDVQNILDTQQKADLRSDHKVIAVAVGYDPRFKSKKNEANRQGIETIENIPDLNQAMLQQTLKLHVLGRRKEKNPYDNWSKEKKPYDWSNDPLRRAIEPERGSSIKAPVHEHYQKQKWDVRQMMNWADDPATVVNDEEDITISDLMSEEGSDSDDYE